MRQKIKRSNVKIMDYEKATELALITCIIINEDILGGTVMQTFDRAFEYAKEFYLLNNDKNWEEQALDFDEAVVQFVKDRLELPRLRSEVAWWREYGHYVAKTHNTVDAEACGFADGTGEE